MDQLKPLLTVKQVAVLLSFKPMTIRKYIYQRKLPVVRIGKAVRIKQDVIASIIENGLRD